MLKYVLALLLSCCLNRQMCAQQALQGRFVMGSFSGFSQYRLDASQSSGNPVSYNRGENHDIFLSLGYGYFYKGNRSILFGVNSGLGFDQNDDNKNWRNSFGGQIRKGHYYSVVEGKLWLSLAQELAYQYSYNRSYGGNQSIANPVIISHSGRFTLFPGMLFKPGKKIWLSIHLPLLSVGLTKRNDYQGGNSVYYNYNILGVTNISSIQLGISWMPYCIQKKKP